MYCRAVAPSPLLAFYGSSPPITWDYPPRSKGYVHWCSLQVLTWRLLYCTLTVHMGGWWSMLLLEGHLAFLVHVHRAEHCTIQNYVLYIVQYKVQCSFKFYLLPLSRLSIAARYGWRVSSWESCSAAHNVPHTTRRHHCKVKLCIGLPVEFTGLIVISTFCPYCFIAYTIRLWYTLFFNPSKDMILICSFN